MYINAFNFQAFYISKYILHNKQFYCLSLILATILLFGFFIAKSPLQLYALELFLKGEKH